MSNARRLLLLCTELNGRGGIQRFNRNLLAASTDVATEIEIVSVHDSRQAGTSTTQPVKLVGCAGNRVRFLFRILQRLLFGRIDVLLVGHVNFAVAVAAGLSLRIGPAPVTLLVAHGIEVWHGIAGLRRRALRRFTRILCVSDYTRGRIEAQAPELAADRFVHFPNALDAAWNVSGDTTSTGRREPRPYILSVGRLDREDRTKGIVTTLEALAGTPSADLDYVVVGTGSDLDALRRVADRLGLAGRVHFVGPVGDDQLKDLYRGCLAFVLPSGQEGFGIVFLEAMSQGAPVIAARAKGAVDVVEHELSGLLVEYGDVVALRESLERLRTDELLRRRLARQARGLVEADGAFTFGAFRRRWHRVLREVRP